MKKQIQSIKPLSFRPLLHRPNYRNEDAFSAFLSESWQHRRHFRHPFYFRKISKPQKLFEEFVWQAGYYNS